MRVFLLVRLPSVDTGLGTSADPDAVLDVLGKILTVEGAEEIAEAGETDDELVAESRLQELTRKHDGVRIQE